MKDVPEVFFAPIGTTGGGPLTGRGMLEKIPEIMDNAGLENAVSERDLVAVKVHFGEMGCSSFVPSLYVREVVKGIVSRGGLPFLTDSTVLYLGKRRNARDHVMTAHTNGFNMDSTGAPVLIADGLRGAYVQPTEVNGKYFDTVDVAGCIYDADSMVVVSHVTGHGLTGFAGTFKNLGMGAVGRKVKLAIHELVRPTIETEKCDACATCMKHCPANSISIDKSIKSAVVDLDTCIGCGECMTVCPNGAVSIDWRGDSDRAQEKLIEAASAVITQKKGKTVLMNFLINLTPSCDCFQASAAPMVCDIGLLSSLDPVALDQASADLVLKAPAASDMYTDPDRRFKPVGEGSWDAGLKYAEQLGLGSREYKLVEI